MTIKLVLSNGRTDGQTGFLASVGPDVSVTTDVIGECELNSKFPDITIIFSGNWPACLHMSRPEGYYKTDDCRTQRFYVCQNNAADSSPVPQGGAFYIFLNTFMFKCVKIIIGISFLSINQKPTSTLQTT